MLHHVQGEVIEGVEDVGSKEWRGFVADADKKAAVGVVVDIAERQDINGEFIRAKGTEGVAQGLVNGAVERADSKHALGYVLQRWVAQEDVGFHIPSC